MKIKDLVQKIIEYSHNEDTPDTNLGTKALSWLNSAYHELLQENLSYLKHKMLKEEKLIVQNKAIILPSDFYILDRIKLANGKVINQTETDKYYIESGLLFIESAENDTLVQLVYIPNFTDLSMEDSVSSMHVSSNYIQSLIWGSLVWSSIYERGIHTSSEISLFESKWNQAKQNFKITLSTYSDQFLRTQPYKFI